MNVFELPLFQQVAPVLSEELSSSQKEFNIDLLGTGRVSSILHVIRSPRSVTYWIWSWLGWWKILLVEELLLLVVEQLSNPILLSIRALMRSLAEVEVTCILFRRRLLQFREEIHGVLDKFLVLLRSVSQEVSARAIDDADVPV